MQRQWLIFAYVVLASLLAFGWFVYPTQWDRDGHHQVNRFTGDARQCKLLPGP